MKKVHFIGIAGKGTAPIAKMMKDLGWKVTGSDIDVFEPMPTLLNKSGIEWYEGFDPKRVHDVDIVVIGGSMLMKNKENPEFLEAIKIGKQPVGFEALLREFVIKENSIVVAGTYGKSTTSALLTWIFKEAGKNPSFMTAGQPVNFDSGVETTDSTYSILEGDEYASVWGYDMKPRFVYYQPKQVLLTATQWDHINIYPTEESYIQAFRELAKLAHDNSGFILSALNGQNNNTIRAYFKSLGGKNFTYAVNQTESNLVDYSGQIIKYDKDKTTFKVFCKNKDLGTFTTLLMGDHNIENCVGAIGMSHLLGLDMKSVNDAVATFKGLKVHLELVGKTEKGSEIFSDLAHSAVKAKSTLEALRTRYKTEKIVAIFDPHASSLSERKSLDWYPGTFDLASEVIIPHVSVKKSTPKDQRVYGTDIVNAIKQTQQNAKYMPLDESIVEYLLNCDENTVIVFMSSGSWRGIIEKIVK